ncbi:MAG: RNA pseudouridine synthase [Spirochaetaceae bacterium]|jgi:RluA family pseudouridine synthase|nr:RNA pseudouridine synthase [Spirochaetaceae bacterium]
MNHAGLKYEEMKRGTAWVVVWENAAFFAVNKASGLALCPERWDRDRDSLVRLLEKERGKRLFVCHRIDRETSGLAVFAKTSDAHKRLSAAFEKRLVQKRYTVILHGHPLWRETDCDLPLLPDGNKKHGTIVDKYRGKPSRTCFRVLFSAGSYTVAEAEPYTGRTHQIRVHAAALGHPVVCDTLYGSANRNKTGEAVYLSSFKRGWRGDKFAERPLLARLGLHAAALTLPVECGLQEPLFLEALPPRDMAATVAQMEKCGSAPYGGIDNG